MTGAARMLAGVMLLPIVVGCFGIGRTQVEPASVDLDRLIVRSTAMARPAGESTCMRSTSRIRSRLIRMPSEGWCTSVPRRTSTSGALATVLCR